MGMAGGRCCKYSRHLNCLDWVGAKELDGHYRAGPPSAARQDRDQHQLGTESDDCEFQEARTVGSVHGSAACWISLHLSVTPYTGPFLIYCTVHRDDREGRNGRKLKELGPSMSAPTCNKYIMPLQFFGSPRGRSAAVRAAAPWCARLQYSLPSGAPTRGSGREDCKTAAVWGSAVERIVDGSFCVQSRYNERSRWQTVQQA